MTVESGVPLADSVASTDMFLGQLVKLHCSIKMIMHILHGLETALTLLWRNLDFSHLILS